MGNPECMIFAAAKRLNTLNGRQLALSVNGTHQPKSLGVNVDSSSNLESQFDKMYKRAAGRFNLIRSIWLLIDNSSAEKIYKAIIQPVLTYCGTLGICQSCYHKTRGGSHLFVQLRQGVEKNLSKSGSKKAHFEMLRNNNHYYISSIKDSREVFKNRLGPTNYSLLADIFRLTQQTSAFYIAWKNAWTLGLILMLSQRHQSSLKSHL